MECGVRGRVDVRRRFGDGSEDLMDEWYGGVVLVL